MTRALIWFVALSIATPLFAAEKNDHEDAGKAATNPNGPFKVKKVETSGTVRVGGKKIEYNAYAGTIIVHPSDWSDVPENNQPAKDNKPSVASMFYAAYFKKGARPEDRPITFIYNGGPGSATVWLHMGAFGPQRIITANNTHTPAAPYSVVNNDYSLLDASDLVFIDAPGAGFSRIAGTNREKDFYGVDEDGYAFTEFIQAFLSRYGRWNSPKFLFGESYGTTRNAVLSYDLERRAKIDLNGVIMLSQILMFDANVDSPQHNPGIDLPYVLALPTYAATAWYHQKLPDRPKNLESFLKQVETFAMGEYSAALSEGSSLSSDRKQAIAQKLHEYIGLPVAYILKANLRVNGGEFQIQLLGASDETTGRLDTRFTGPSMDPLGQESEYDPQSASISAAYLAAFNDYARKVLKYGDDQIYLQYAKRQKPWNFIHQPPNGYLGLTITTNVMPDLAAAMIYNPNLKVMLNAGYFDLATPYFEGMYEMRHLPIPEKLQKNIEYKFYQSGHMVYANEASLKALHDNVAAFITRNSNIR